MCRRFLTSAAAILVTVWGLAAAGFATWQASAAGGPAAAAADGRQASESTLAGGAKTGGEQPAEVRGQAGATDLLNQWPGWRGPLANGTAPLADPPLEWSPTEGIRWKAPLPGQGTSTPIVWGERVFVLTAIEVPQEASQDEPGVDGAADQGPADRAQAAPAGDGASPRNEAATGQAAAENGRSDAPPARPDAGGRDRPARGRTGRGAPDGDTAGRPGGSPRPARPAASYQFVVIAFDRTTGEVAWQQVARQERPHEGHHRDHGYASASPTTDGRRLYVSFGSRGIYCYDYDGKLEWETDLGDMQTRNGFGEGASPAVYGERLIVPWDHEGPSFLAVLETRTGQLVWKVQRDEITQWATPLVVDRGGRVQVITNGTNRVRSYDLATGRLFWECGGQTTSAIPSPVAEGELVYCMSGFRGKALYAIPLAAEGDITDSKQVAWRHDRGTPYVPSPLLYDGLLYFTDTNRAVLSVLSAATGEVLVDRRRLPGIDNIYASPLAAAGRIYFVGRDGATVVVKPGAELEVLATNRLDDPIDASPAAAGRELFLRSAAHLYCLGG